MDDFSYAAEEEALRQERRARRGDVRRVLLGIAVSLSVSLAVVSATSAAPREFVKTDLKGADLSGQNLVGARFQGTNVAGVNFSGADLTKAQFMADSDLKKANFTGANLTRATFQDVDLHGANFTRACLLQAKLANSDLREATFDEAILVQAQLVQVDQADASFVGTIWHGPAQCPEKTGVEAAAAAPTLRPEVITRARDIRLALGHASGGGRVDLAVNFQVNSDKIEGAGQAQILEIATALRDPNLSRSRIRVEGHTDSSGDDQYNLDLSYRRAIRVVRLLAEKYGIARDRLEAKGYGETQPRASNREAQGRALNRRVTLVNLGAN